MKTKSAAESARRSADSAVQQIRRGSLLTLLPQLHRVEDEIDNAVRIESVDLLLAWLSIWRWQASELRGHLDSTSTSERKAMKAIQSSMTAAAEVKVELVGQKSVHLSVMTANLRKAIASATRELGSLSAVREFDIGESISGK